MITTYQVYEIKDNRTYDTVGPSYVLPISKQFDNVEEAVDWIKQKGSFSAKYTILPIYEVTIDDIDER